MYSVTNRFMPYNAAMLKYLRIAVTALSLTACVPILALATAASVQWLTPFQAIHPPHVANRHDAGGAGDGLGCPGQLTRHTQWPTTVAWHPICGKPEIGRG